MAWNEPGSNNNNKDPWKNQGGRDQGPPDLDDILKNVFKKFGGSGGRRGGGGSGGLSFGNLGLGLIVAILVVIWGISGFYTVREAERGVVMRFGQFNKLVEPGLQWRPTFIDTVVPVDVQTIRYLPASGFMLTEDENVVSVEMEVQYKVIEPYQFTFSVTDPSKSLRQALDAALRYVVGHSKMDDILTSGREVVRQQVREELDSVIAPYNMGIVVTDVNFKDARPPEQVKAAFDDAIAAQEDEQRFIREAEAYAREIEPRARGQVRRMEEEAQAYKERVILEARGEVARFEELLPQYQAAPEVTRRRIYLETLEQVYSNTSKIMVDSKGSGNMMYLPLDKIMENSGSTGTPAKSRSTIEGLRNSPTSGTNTPTTSSDGVRGDRFNSGRN
ncbi:FtsH protease activity modulator HflK [Paraneptunicella aestuarii]|uniref:FtsH protease activity modulator HflK n=1 Tax=Paraneptunicella aestuarii TaxID=2831148 RepID=UPI001E3C9EA7|nr:FtsH protease activity modulator HflK [Paraneptunicella aestuarii]UAA38968.1 FtsH protease activity modulator HflK [Paraneptunicella aestuarii]